MSILRRPTAMKTALNLISRKISPYSSSSFRSIRILAGVSIPRPTPSKPHVFFRGFSAMPTNSEVNETTLVDGRDNDHWFIVMEAPKGNPSRDEIIDMYIKTLAKVLGSEEEARMKIYSVSTKHYFAFGCEISQELANKLEPLPNVEWVFRHYLDPVTKKYGGEPFINGKAVPYDPKYHEEWVRNNAHSGDRHRNMDRSRNSERRREMRQNAFQRPLPERTSEAPQGNTMQGAPDSQGRSY